jgi:hypothetical protein
LALASAGLATVTLSACYGPGCVSTVKLPDGGTGYDSSIACGTVYDCNTAADGGTPAHDSEWDRLCK